LQTLGVENFEKSENVPSAQEYWNKLSASIKDIPIHTFITLKRLPHMFKDVFMREWTKDTKEFNIRWESTKHSIFSGIVAALANVKSFIKSTTNQLDEFETKYLQSAESDLKEKYSKSKIEIKSKLEQLESALKLDIEDISTKWADYLQHIHHTINHAPHHPTLSCRNCEKIYTLQEFLEMVHDRGYFLKVEDWWTDEEVEEFYEGWGVWANRSAIHCPNCDAVKWENVHFVSEEEEKRLEKEEL